MTGRDEPEISSTIAELRKSHADIGLDASDLDPDPLRQFAQWLSHALESGLILPNTMTLATATRDGRPSARMVLLKGIDAGGFVFYTNYASGETPSETKAQVRACLGAVASRFAPSISPEFPPRAP